MAGTLSSDILERQFGPTRIEILYQKGNERIICTKPVNDDQILELSRVTFIPAATERFADVHRAILGGESMGKAFRAAGIGFERKLTDPCNHSLPHNFNRLFGANESESATIMDVAILVGPHGTHYADILETYSPAVDMPYVSSMPTEQQWSRLQKFNEFLSQVKG